MNIESTIYGKFGVGEIYRLAEELLLLIRYYLAFLFLFSFFKAPIGVIKELVNIQRRFLWGGGSDSKKMCWVSWDRICQPKDRSGLGVKNLELFNNSLLCKGKWRGLSYSLAPWKNLLSFRYGSLVDNFLHGRGRLNLFGGATCGSWVMKRMIIGLGQTLVISLETAKKFCFV
jgi:hypothetical protein